MLSPDTIPKGFEVQPIDPDGPAVSAATCGTCGLTWDDGVVTDMTPAPSGRCPFEAFHEDEQSTSTSAPDGSVYDAIYLAVAERRGVELGTVRTVLLHREVPGDSFWQAWDIAVSEADSLYGRVTGEGESDDGEF